MIHRHQEIAEVGEERMLLSLIERKRARLRCYFIPIT